MRSRYFTRPQQGEKGPPPSPPESSQVNGNGKRRRSRGHSHKSSRNSNQSSNKSGTTRPSQDGNQSSNKSGSTGPWYVEICPGDAVWTALEKMDIAPNGGTYTIQIAALTAGTTKNQSNPSSTEAASVSFSLPNNTVTKLKEPAATAPKRLLSAPEPSLVRPRVDSEWFSKTIKGITKAGNPVPQSPLVLPWRSDSSLQAQGSASGDISTMPPAQSNAAGPRAIPPRTSISQPGPSQSAVSSAAQHGTSRIWFSSEAKIQRAWFKLEPHLTRMYPEGGKSAQSLCPYIPRNIRDFTTHLSEFEDLKLGRTRRILNQKALMQSIAKDREGQVFAKEFDVSDIPLPAPRDAFDDKIKDFGSIKEQDVREDTINPAFHSNPANRSAVLSQQTVWCVNPDVPWREAANWPTMQEMKWEGIQRVSTENGKYGRFLALPRVPAAPEISWQTLPLTKFYPLDEVWRIPNEEDVFAPTEDIPEELESALLNKDILDSINPVNCL